MRCTIIRYWSAVEMGLRGISNGELFDRGARIRETEWFSLVPRSAAASAHHGLHGVYCAASERGTRCAEVARCYGLLETTCGAGLRVSSWALTFWICPACSFAVAARASISFCCFAPSVSCLATVDLSCAMVASCWSILRCALRNSLSNITLTAS